MRIIIYGAGAIGSVIGGHLWRTGQETVLIGREGHVTAIKNRGLKLVTPGKTHILTVPAVTSPDQLIFRNEDVIFLCMKSQNTDQAVRDLRKIVPFEVPVFCIQNGVRNEEMAAGQFPRVYGAMIRIGSEYLTAGEVLCRRDPPGWLIIGCYPSGSDSLCEAVAQNLRAASFLARVTANVMPYKWGKLFTNLGNAVDAITGSHGPEVEPIIRAASQEFSELTKAAGIEWVSQEQIAREWPEVAQPPRATIAGAGFSSTWQSLMRQQGSSETEYLNGEIERLAQKLGRSAPVNTKLVELTQEMARNREQPGKYTPEELRSILGV